VKVVECGRTRMMCVLCECVTWYCTLKEERRLRVFKTRVLRNVLGPKREELTGEWGRWVGVCMGRGVYRVLVGEVEEEMPLGRPRQG